jgi:hypothetical protein
MGETLKTAGFVAAALVAVSTAVVIQPANFAPRIMSDQGQLFYPKFIDPQSVKTIEVVDYDEATATARPFQVKFEHGRWVLPASQNYPVDAGDRLVKTAAALMDLRKDLVRSDAPLDQPKLGVVDPLDQKAAGLTGRGKRVTLRDARGDVLADYILGKPVEGKQGYRYVRVPGEKRTYAVKTDADPSARFSDWVNSGILRIPAASIRKVAIHSYTLDESSGTLANLDSITLTHEDGQWKMSGAEKLNTAAIDAMAATLDNLKIVDVRAKPPTLAHDLKNAELRLSIETAVSLRQKGFFVTPEGHLLASAGEMTIETAAGAAYTLRFGEAATGDGKADNRYLFATVSGNPALNAKFSDWYYVIANADFEKLRLKKKDIAR